MASRNRYSLEEFNQQTFLLDELLARLRATPTDRLSDQYRRFIEWVEIEVERWLTRAAKDQLAQWLDEGDKDNPPWTRLAAPVPAANLEAFVADAAARLPPNARQAFVSDFVASAAFEVKRFDVLAVFVAKYPAAAAAAPAVIAIVK